MKRSEERSIAADKFTANKRYFIERIRWLDGAEWADATLIEKACEWWENELSYPSMTQEEIRWYKNKINEFRKAMKGK